MHKNSVLLFEKYCKKYFTPNMNILEIGPDKFPSSFNELFYDNYKKWDTMDIYESNKLTYKMLDTVSFPIDDAKYDIVLAANVIEHVSKPWLWIKEVTRICKPNGIVITINPVSWPYHEAPIDCYRYYPEGMISLYEEGGLKIIEMKMENLEHDLKKYPRVVQGAEKPFKKWKLMFMRLTGYPLEFALDILTIGKKQ